MDSPPSRRSPSPSPPPAAQAVGRLDSYLSKKLSTAKSEIERLRSAVLRSPRATAGALAAAPNATSGSPPASQGSDGSSAGVGGGNDNSGWVPAAWQSPSPKQPPSPPHQPVAAGTGDGAHCSRRGSSPPSSAAASGSPANDEPNASSQLLAAARAALAERDAQVAALHQQVQRLSSYVDSCMTSDGASSAQLEALQGQLLQRSAELSAAQEELAATRTALSEACAAAEQEQEAAVVFARQVAALRAVIIDRLIEADAKLHTAVEREQQLEVDKRATQQQVQAAEARAKQAELQAGGLRGELSEVRRQLERAASCSEAGSDVGSSSSSGSGGDESSSLEGAGVLTARLQEAETGAAELARILVDREEELEALWRYCEMLEQQLVRRDLKAPAGDHRGVQQVGNSEDRQPQAAEAGPTCTEPSLAQAASDSGAPTADPAAEPAAAEPAAIKATSGRLSPLTLLRQNYAIGGSPGAGGAGSTRESSEPQQIVISRLKVGIVGIV